MNTSTADGTIVIGAGIVGICCGLSLLEKGEAVTIIDRDAPGQGASYGNAGVISPWSNVPQSLPGVWKSIPKWLLDPEGPVAVRPGYLLKAMPWAIRFLRAGAPERITAISDAMSVLTRPSVDLYRHHLRGTGHEDLVKDSWYLHVYRRAEEASLGDAAGRLRERQDTPIEIISGQQLREIEPALSPEYEAAIVIRDQARAITPGRIGEVLTEKLRSMGGKVLRGTVHRLRPQGESRAGGESWVAETDLGELTAPRVVLAAGAWSARLLEPLGVRLPLEAERGYHLVFKNPGVALNNSVMEVEGKFVTSSMDTGIRSAGTAEFAGLDAPPDYRRARIFKRLTKRMLPDINTDEVEEWMGVRPSFPDSLPCIGEMPGLPGLFAAFGHSHYGLMMAPATGRVVADLVTTAPPNVDLAPYRADRFA